MAKYLAGQIILGKLQYEYVIIKWPQHKFEIDVFLAEKGFKI